MVNKPKRFLYIIACKGAGFCKIGYAINVENRLDGLKCGNPFSIFIHSKFEVPLGASASLLELWCQFKLKRYWTKNGEWFKVPASLAVLAVKEVLHELPIVSPLWHASKARRMKTISDKWSDAKHRSKMLKVLNRSGKNNWSDAKFRAKVSARMRKLQIQRWKDPKYRAKMSIELTKASRKAWRNKERRANMSAQVKARWSDPEFKKMMSASISKSAKKHWRSKSGRLALSIAMKKRWKNPKFRIKISKAISKGWAARKSA